MPFTGLPSGLKEELEDIGLYHFCRTVVHSHNQGFSIAESCATAITMAKHFLNEKLEHEQVHDPQKAMIIVSILKYVMKFQEMLLQLQLEENKIPNSLVEQPPARIKPAEFPVETPLVDPTTLPKPEDIGK